MNKVKTAFTLLLLVSVFGIISCRRNPTWDTQILAPLIKTSLSINNLANNATVVTNPADSSVTLQFRDSIYSLTLSNLLQIPDTTLSSSYPDLIPVTTPTQPDSSLPFLSGIISNTQYNMGGADITNAIIRSGSVSLKVTSSLPRVTDYIYSIPNSKPVLTVTLKVPAATGAGVGSADTTVSLSGYSIDFTGPTHNNKNTITTSFSGILDPAAAAYTVQTGNTITVSATFSSIVPEYAQGYFGNGIKIIGPTTANFPLFSKIASGVLDLQNASVDFTINNSIGVDARLFIDSLLSISTRPGGTTIPLTGSLIHNDINIDRALQSYNPASPVIASTKTLSLTNSNSNIINWIDNLPNESTYKLQVQTDPVGGSGDDDFVFYGYGIQAYLDVSVPLYLAANNLILEDTLPVNFANSGQAQQIKSGRFTLYASNQFPFSAGMQIYMLNNNMQVTDSLLIPVQTIAAGVQNANGYVASPQNSILTIPVTASQADMLFSTSHIIIKAIFNTGCATCHTIQYSKIYDTYQLSIKLIGNFDYQVKG